MKRFIQNTFFDKYFSKFEIESDIHSYYNMILSIITDDLKVQMNNNNNKNFRIFLNNQLNIKLSSAIYKEKDLKLSICFFKKY